MPFSHIGPASVTYSLPWHFLTSSSSSSSSSSSWMTAITTPLLLRIYHPFLQQSPSSPSRSLHFLSKLLSSFTRLCKHSSPSDMHLLFSILQTTLHQTTLSSSHSSMAKTTTTMIVKLLKGEIRIVKTCPDVVPLCIQMIYSIAELCRYGKLLSLPSIHIQFFFFFSLPLSFLFSRKSWLDWICTHCLQEGILSLFISLLFSQHPTSQYQRPLMTAIATCLLSIVLHTSNLQLFLSNGGLLFIRLILQSNDEDVLIYALLAISTLLRRWNWNRQRFQQYLSKELLESACQAVHYQDVHVLELIRNSS